MGKLEVGRKSQSRKSEFGKPPNRKSKVGKSGLGSQELGNASTLCLSGFVAPQVEVLIGLEMCLNLFGSSRMRSDTFGCAWKHSEAFGRFRKFLKIFDIF